MRSAVRVARAALILALAVPTAGTAETHRLTDGRIVAPLDSFRECEQCPEMIVLPMGAFMMGAVPGESRNPFDMFREGATFRRRGPDEVNIIPSEHPRHRVEMDIPFAMGRNEVTHGEWMACVAAGGCTRVPDHWVDGPSGRTMLGPRHPVINVSYLDALEYVAWLNSLVGAEVYRLPTEAEWEYAARAGTETQFAQGQELTADQANFSRAGTEQLLGKPMPDLTNRRVPVSVDDLDAANGWGLRHMSGNVSEMTRSCWSDEHLGLPSASAYLEHSQSQPDCWRVIKGGDFASGMDYLRPAKRGQMDEAWVSDDRGFRVVRQDSTKGDE